jgi:predicted regulator of Ras-like GTPase activity (Roadblock/LC7/MglB family)
MSESGSRSYRLDRAIGDLLVQAPEVEAAAVVSFDGLAMASALPATMDEDRVAAMSAALLSLGERAAEGLGRGALNQVYIEGEHGTVFLASADDEAVLVAVASRGAKVGMMLYEVRRAAVAVAEALRRDDAEAVAVAETVAEPAPEPVAEPSPEPAPGYAAAYATDYAAEPVAEHVPLHAVPPSAEPAVDAVVDAVTEAPYAPLSNDPAWPSYLPNGTVVTATEPPAWS